MLLSGIYRGVVVNAADPQGKARLQIQIPSVLGATMEWALPCRDAGSTKLPLPGTAIWVMFEAGDSRKPVWMGCMG